MTIQEINTLFDNRFTREGRGLQWKVPTGVSANREDLQIEDVKRFYELMMKELLKGFSDMVELANEISKK